MRQRAITHVTFHGLHGQYPTMVEPLWKQRLRSYVDNDPRSMKAISLAAGQGETFVRDILERDRTPSIENLIALAETLGKSISELTAEDEPALSDKTVRIMGEIGAGAEIRPEFEQVPEHGIDEIELPFAVPPEIIGFRVKGDSMLPVYRDGDVVLVWKEQRLHVESYIGHEAAVRTEDGRRYLKEIQQGSRRGLFDLHSHNARLIKGVKLAWIGEIYLIVRAPQIRVIAKSRRLLRSPRLK
jgi:phage repressor protein C with HTH and peptisase S24 domain